MSPAGWLPIVSGHTTMGLPKYLYLHVYSCYQKTQHYRSLRVLCNETDDYESNWQVDISNHVPSNEWEIFEHPATKSTRYESCCREPHPYLTFHVKIKRVSVFYTYILVIPCLLLSFLTLVIFWLPPESPAKMILGNVVVCFVFCMKLLTINVQFSFLPRCSCSYACEVFL